MSDQPLTFDDVADLAVELGASVSPSELHGLLVGQLATGKRFSESQWVNEAARLLDVEPPEDKGPTTRNLPALPTNIGAA